VAFRVFSQEPVTREEVVRAIWRESAGFLGENRLSELELWVLDYDGEKQQGFLTCTHRGVEVVKACLTLISAAQEKKIMVHVLGVSGTVKALNRKFLNKVKK
jgi:ribonuclease P/MRP protein subunit POP5